jgi:Flp pilus assembly secretin CpaC/tetratricopeptide (TPR) repeat protein
MRTAAQTTISLVFILALSLQAQPVNQSAIDLARDEALRRQEATLRMGAYLTNAMAARKKNDISGAASLYQEAAKLLGDTQVGNPAVDAERREVIAGLDETRETLARQYMKRGELPAASDQVNSALNVDPDNKKLRTLRMEIDQAVEMQFGHAPDVQMRNRIAGINWTNLQAETLVQNGKLLYEMGQLDEAEKVLLQALNLEPANTAAPYFLDLLKEARYMTDARNRERDTKTELEMVERTWLISTSAERLPQPNDYARSKEIHTGTGRQVVMHKLQEIKLVQMPGTFGEDLEKGLPLSAVLRNLKAISITNDLEKTGINFLYNPHSGGSAAGAADDAAAGLTGAAPPDAETIQIKINPALDNLTLLELLNAICMEADKPINYSVVDLGVEFFVKPETMALMEERNFHVDPNTFVQGMGGVTISGISGMANTTGGNNGYGGGGYGGSGYGGYGGMGGYGGGMMGGYGGMQGGYGGMQGGYGGYGGGMQGGYGGYGGGMQGGYGGYGGGMQGGYGGMGGYGGGMGGYGGYGGGYGGGGMGQVQGSVTYPSVDTSSIPYLTSKTPTSVANQPVIAYFSAIGINLSATNNNGAFVIFNERTGDILIRATVEQLDIVERVIELLNKIPQEVQVDTKFCSVDQTDSKGLNFGMNLGNFSVGHGSVGIEGGTAPSYQGNPTVNNPSGVFPGPGPVGSNPGQIAPSASDTDLTAGLRSIAPGAPSSATAPATIATITGILTDPQFRMTINAIEQRAGSDLLAAPRVTTESGRQAHVSVNDIISIVSSVSLPTSTTVTTSGLGGTTTAGNALNQISYSTTPFTSGPALDILPTISADGYSIQMVLIPSLTEFVGYDSPGQFVPESQVANASTIGVPITAVLPLPHYRVRQVITAVNVWDGQTIMLGGLISESIAKLKDKVPVLGDLPLLGRFFQSVYSYSDKENLMVFVTATIIDPAGNRVHTDEEMPFARNSIPPQPPQP